MKKNIYLFTLLLLGIFIPSLQAEVKLPAIFGDHMVLQRNEAVRIWGWADKGERVEVLMAGQSKKARADKNGCWEIHLDPLSQGGPYMLEVKGRSNTLSLNDILIGEVWLCSGQSNMEMQVNTWGQVYNVEEEIKEANYPFIRSFNVEKAISMTPQNNVKGKWEICSPETVSEFSAVAYFFARKLYQELQIPIGIINSSWGGTDVESWTSPEAFGKLDDPYKVRYKEIKIIDSENLVMENAKGEMMKVNPNMYSSLLYNGMINPLIPLTIKGAIWYQGENNAGRAYNYRTLFPNMITDWRTKFGKEFPFYWVQLANFMAKDDEPKESNWAELREAQTLTLSLPKTGQAVITDIGDADDIHPRNKQDVGLRLALIALNKDYGYKDLIYSGPVYKSSAIDGNKLILSFENVGKGLVLKNKYGYVEGFAIAGADGKYHWAKGYLDGNKVILYSDKVASPVTVRYSWSNNPDVNLFNSEGLPAVPFRTDTQKGITEK